METKEKESKNKNILIGLGIIVVLGLIVSNALLVGYVIGQKHDFKQMGDGPCGNFEKFAGENSPGDHARNMPQNELNQTKVPEQDMSGTGFAPEKPAQ